MITRLPVENPRRELDNFAHQLKMRRHLRYFIFYSIMLLVFSLSFLAKIRDLDHRIKEIEMSQLTMTDVSPSNPLNEVQT